MQTSKLDFCSKYQSPQKKGIGLPQRSREDQGLKVQNFDGGFMQLAPRRLTEQSFIQNGRQRKLEPY